MKFKCNCKNIKIDLKYHKLSFCKEEEKPLRYSEILLKTKSTENRVISVLFGGLPFFLSDPGGFRVTISYSAVV